MDRRLDDLNNNGIKDTKEVKSFLSKSREWVGKNKLTVGLAAALLFSLGSKINIELTNFKTVEKEVTKEVVKYVPIRTVAQYDGYTCVNTKEMYDIRKEEVVSKGIKKLKHARGLELPDGYSLYITEFTPIKGKK